MSLNQHTSGFLSFQIEGFTSLDLTTGCDPPEERGPAKDCTSNQLWLTQEPFGKSILTDSALLAVHSTGSAQSVARLSLFPFVFSSFPSLLTARLCFQTTGQNFCLSAAAIGKKPKTKTETQNKTEKNLTLTIIN